MITVECLKCGCQWQYEGVCINPCPECNYGDLGYSMGIEHLYKPIIIKHGDKN